SGRFDIGGYEMERFQVSEVDAQGRRRRHEDFALDHLGDAVVRLYERYAELLPEGPERARAAAAARAVAAMPGSVELDRLAGAYAPAMEVVDHRILGTWSGRGAEGHLRHWRCGLELADCPIRFDDVLGLRTDALVCRTTSSGTDRAGGGAFEGEMLTLWAFGADGRWTRVEVFDGDHETEALARFDELGQSSAEPPPTASRAARIENAATRLLDRFVAAWAAHDWERVAAGHTPDFRGVDRRRMIRLELDRGEWVETLRFYFELRTSRFTPQLLAARGDRLALVRWRFEGSGSDIGASEIEFLEILEVDDHGGAVGAVICDPDDLDAAYVELDARYAAGEAAPY